MQRWAQPIKHLCERRRAEEERRGEEERRRGEEERGEGGREVMSFKGGFFRLPAAGGVESASRDTSSRLGIVRFNRVVGRICADGTSVESASGKRFASMVLWVQHNSGLSESSHSLESKTSSTASSSDDEDERERDHDDMVLFGEEDGYDDIFDHAEHRFGEYFINNGSKNEGNGKANTGNELIEWNSAAYWVERINLLVTDFPVMSNRSHQGFEIVPSLYIGSEHTETELGEWTHVLRCDETCRPLRNPSAIVSDSVVELQNLCFESSTQETEPFLTMERYQIAEEFISNSLEGGGIVLLTCLDGMNYAPAVAIAYLTKNRGKPLMEAISMCKNACNGGPILLKRKLQQEMVDFAIRSGLSLC